MSKTEQDLHNHWLVARGLIEVRHTITKKVRTITIPQHLDMVSMYIAYSTHGADLIHGLDYRCKKKKITFIKPLEPVPVYSKDLLKEILQRVGIVKRSIDNPVLFIQYRKSKTQFEIDFPHGAICLDCGIAKGGKMPPDSANTMTLEPCPYCGKGEGTLALSDFNWPAYNRRYIWD